MLKKALTTSFHITLEFTVIVSEVYRGKRIRRNDNQNLFRVYSCLHFSNNKCSLPMKIVDNITLQ